MHFWKYDLFPYVLGAEIIEITDTGNVIVKGYHGPFKPIKILPLVPGEELLKNIKAIKSKYEEEKFNLDDEYLKKIIDIIPEAIT